MENLMVTHYSSGRGREWALCDAKYWGEFGDENSEMGIQKWQFNGRS